MTLFVPNGFFFFFFSIFAFRVVFWLFVSPNFSIFFYQKKSKKRKNLRTGNKFIFKGGLMFAL